jgi:hypothetical protein
MRAIPPDGEAAAHAALQDPEFIEALRAAALSLNQSPVAAAGDKTDPPEPERVRKFAALRAQFWQLAAALLVSGAAFAGAFVYMRFTSELAQTGKELGQVRRELGLVRNEIVRKEEFNGRHLAAHALLRELEAGSRLATEGGLQRQQEQKQALEDLRPRLEDLRREVERFQQRLNGGKKKAGTDGKKAGAEVRPEPQ